MHSGDKMEASRASRAGRRLVRSDKVEEAAVASWSRSEDMMSMCMCLICLCYAMLCMWTAVDGGERLDLIINILKITQSKFCT